MFHMLSSFSLEPETSPEAFAEALEAFVDHMRELGLLCSASPLGRRCRDTPMDTADDAAFEYFFVMTFADRAQSDRAYERIANSAADAGSLHARVMRKIREAEFICWRDL